MNMKCGYLSDWTLEMVLEAAPQDLLDKTWVIVALDSSRGERLRNSYEYLKNQFPGSAEWTDSGIRLPGRDLLAMIEKSRILVPFSAAFVFDQRFSSPSRLYNLTSESETFEETAPRSLEINFSNPGVLAYFADGCGLNYCLADGVHATFLSHPPGKA